MEPEAYQQAVAEGATETAQLLALFLRVAAGAVVAAVGLAAVIWWRDSVLDNLNQFFAAGAAARFRWLLRLPGVAYWFSGCSLAAGVFAAAFSFDQSLRRQRRFWQRTPLEVAVWQAGEQLAGKRSRQRKRLSATHASGPLPTPQFQAAANRNGDRQCPPPAKSAS